MYRDKSVLINYLGRKNAGPVFSIEFARAIAKNGYKVYAIIAAGADNVKEWEDEELFEEVFIIYTYNSNFEFVKETARFFSKVRRQIKKHYQNEVFDFIICPFYHPWATFVNDIIRSKSVITVCHDPISHSGSNKIYEFMFDHFIRSSDFVVVLTRSFINVVHKKYGIDKEKIVFMPHGLLKVYKEKQNLLLPPKYSAKNINFLFFGRIEKYKGISVLVEAYKKITLEYSNVTLTIAGKGNIKEFVNTTHQIKGLNIENRYIPDEEVGAFFDGPNVCTILPYLDATQSGVIPIAIEYGTPIIASNTGGLKEQMLDGAFGIFSSPGDIEGLYEAMKQIIEKKDIFLREKLKMQEFAKALEWCEVIKKLLIEIG